MLKYIYICIYEDRLSWSLTTFFILSGVFSLDLKNSDVINRCCQICDNKKRKIIFIELIVIKWCDLNQEHIIYLNCSQYVFWLELAINMMSHYLRNLRDFNTRCFSSLNFIINSLAFRFHQTKTFANFR